MIALMPDVTPSRFRSQANGIINLMGGIGSILAFLGGSMLYKINPAFPFWMGSVLVISAAGLLLVFLREPKEYPPAGEEPSMFRNLSETLRDKDKSALRLFLSIFFWFLSYTAIEAFFTLYTENHLGLSAADGSRLLSHLSLFFVLFALVAGLVGSKVGRRTTISIGICLLGVTLTTIFFLPSAVLTTVLAELPVLGTIPVVSLLLMVCGAAWAFININSLPMVVDLTTSAKLGTFTESAIRPPASGVGMKGGGAQRRKNLPVGVLGV